MPEYLFTAHNPDGRKVTERIDAASANAAVQALRDEGYANIVLHTDDVGAQYTRHSAVEEHISPREYVAFRRFSGYFDRVLFLTRKLYAVGWMFYLPLVVILAVRRVAGLPWDFWDFLPAALLLLPLVLAAFRQLSNPVFRYNRLVEAVAWGRWEEVLRRLPSVKGQVAADEAAFRAGQALAGLGRVDEGLEVVRPFADGSRIPAWLYHARLVSVYFAAGRPDDMLATMEKAVELAPDNATLLIDLAMGQLRHRRDWRRAGPLLERARQHAVSDLAAPFLELAEGMLVLEKGDPREAIGILEKALAAMEAFARASPLMEAATDQVHTYLALAHAAVGETAAAERHFRQAEPRLRALHLDELLRRCEEALGLHS